MKGRRRKKDIKNEIDRKIEGYVRGNKWRFLKGGKEVFIGLHSR